MLKKILVPLDGSDLSETAIPCAQQLARRHHAEVVLVQVIPHLGELAPGLALELLPEMQARAERRALNYLENRAGQFAPLEVTVHPATGSPREEIPLLSQRLECDLTVLASHGRDGASHWLLGSVAEGILRRSPCPVLLVRPSTISTGCFRRVLLPVDGSEASLKVLQLLPDFLASDAKVTLLQSSGVSLVPNFPDRSKTVQTYLDGVEAELRKIHQPGLAIEVVVLEGTPVDDILSWSASQGCDLIAMSSHSRAGIGRAFLGSVSEKVARHAPCDVLIFPYASI